MKKFLVFIILVLFLVPTFSFAQGANNRLIPCDGANCDFNHLMQLLNNIIKYIILISAPVAASVIAYAGFIIMTSGVSDKISQAKEMIKKVVIGFVFILGAWIIVDTILIALLGGNFKDIIKLN